MADIRRGIAVPNFGSDPAAIADLGVAAERAGFDGFFVWDHIVFDNTGEGPPIVDPWLVLAVTATRTSAIRLGTMITPVPRRRPWQLARQTATLDVLSGGRLTLGVGIGSPAYADFGIFHEVTDERVRGQHLDEGLAIMNGLWSGEKFAFRGERYAVDPVRFNPRPVQRPRIPIWVGGTLEASKPVQRAARWDGMVPLRFENGSWGQVSAGDLAEIGRRIAAERGSLDGTDLVVWADIDPDPDAVAAQLDDYISAGATWWIETARPVGDWWESAVERVARGV